MGPKLMKCCKLEQQSRDYVETNSNSRGRQCSCKGSKKWKIEGQNRRITRNVYQRLLNKFEMEGFMAQEGLWNLARNKALQDRGALLGEEGDTIRELEGNA